MLIIDIDTGGTFTDGFFTHNGELTTVKVLSTPHDFTVCLAECIKEASKQLHRSVEEILADADVVRYSSTIGVNTLITRTGAKIGLLVTKGYQDSIYASDSIQAEPLFDLVARPMVAEVQEAIRAGQQAPEPAPEAVYQDLYVSMEVPR